MREMSFSSYRDCIIANKRLEKCKYSVSLSDLNERQNVGQRDGERVSVSLYSIALQVEFPDWSCCASHNIYDSKNSLIGENILTVYRTRPLAFREIFSISYAPWSRISDYNESQIIMDGYWFSSYTFLLTHLCSSRDLVIRIVFEFPLIMREKTHRIRKVAEVLDVFDFG